MNEISTNKNYDLEERTTKFAEAIMQFAKTIPDTMITQRIIPQLIGAGTSVGANYCEATNAEPKKDFAHKIGICNKEARETKYWLRIIAKTLPELATAARPLWMEANELNLIFSASIRTAKKLNLTS